MPDDQSAIRLLFFGVDSVRERPVDVGEEHHRITSALAVFGDRINLIVALKSRRDDLSTLLLKHSPHIVHFSGHGVADGTFVMVGDDGQPDFIAGAVIVGTIEELRDNIKLVVFNACFSDDDARRLSASIDFTVGMGKEIDDTSAIRFASAFYKAIAAGRSVQSAFNLGKVELIDTKDAQRPRLFCRTGVDPKTATLRETHTPLVDEPGRVQELLSFVEARLARLVRQCALYLCLIAVLFAVGVMAGAYLFLVGMPEGFDWLTVATGVVAPAFSALPLREVFASRDKIAALRLIANRLRRYAQLQMPVADIPHFLQIESQLFQVAIG